MPGYIGGSIKERASAALRGEPKFRARSRDPMRSASDGTRDGEPRRSMMEISTQTTDMIDHAIRPSPSQYPSMGSPGHRADQMLRYPSRTVSRGGFFGAAVIVVVIIVIYFATSYNYFFFRLESGAVGLE